MPGLRDGPCRTSWYTPVSGMELPVMRHGPLRSLQFTRTDTSLSGHALRFSRAEANNAECIMTKKILIIDDDPAIVEFLEDFFQDNGYETVVAYNGSEGLNKALESKPDLITLDMDMPKKGGTLFYAGLRRSTELREVPTIVISGVGPRPPQLHRNVPVLTKPVDNNELMTMVKGYLG